MCAAAAVAGAGGGAGFATCNCGRGQVGIFDASVATTSRAMWAMGGGAAEVAMRARTFELI